MIWKLYVPYDSINHVAQVNTVKLVRVVDSNIGASRPHHKEHHRKLK